jgi:effector-binding domain-containing protein
MSFPAGKWYIRFTLDRTNPASQRNLPFAWIETQGLRISGPIREVYPNDPRFVKPEEIITEIFVPVR